MSTESKNQSFTLAQIEAFLNLLNPKFFIDVIPFLKARGLQDLWLAWLKPDEKRKKMMMANWDKAKVDGDFDKIASLAKKHNNKGYEQWLKNTPADVGCDDLPYEQHRVKYLYFEDNKILPFKKDVKIQGVRSKMDTQKTRTVIQFIKENELKFVIFPTSREKMADAVQGVFLEFGIPVLHYQDLKANTDLASFKGVLVIQMESFHKLNNHDLVDPDLLVLDECTSLMKQLDSPTMFKRYQKNIAAFEQVVKVSNKIIFMDADIDNRILFPLLRLTDDEENIEIQWNTKKREGVRAMKLDNKGEFIRIIKYHLGQGKRIYIPSTSKTFIKELQLLIEEILPTKRFLAIHSENAQDPKVKFGIQNVGKWWTQFDVVAVSPTITNGIDFHEEHFDLIMAYVNARGCCARDVKQMIGRVRKIRDNIIGYFIDNTLKGYRPNSAFKIRELLDLKYRYNVKLEEQMMDKEEKKEKEDSKSKHIQNLIHDKTEVWERVNGVSRVIKVSHWLLDVHILNELEQNLSWNDIEKEFEKTLIGQGIPIISCPVRQQDLAEGSELTLRLKEAKGALKEFQKTEYENIPCVSKEEGERLKKLCDSRSATVDEIKIVEKHEVVKYFDVPLEYEDFQFVKNMKGKFFNIKVEEKCSVPECLRYEKNSKGSPFRHGFAAQLDAIRRLIPFLGFQPGVTLCQVPEFSTEPFFRNYVQGMQMLTDLKAAFSIHTDYDGPMNMKVGIIILKNVFEIWTGGQMKAIEGNRKQIRIDSVQINIQKYKVTYNSRMGHLYSHFNCDQFLEDIRTGMTRTQREEAEFEAAINGLATKIREDNEFNK